MAKIEKQPAQITISSNVITGILIVLLVGAAFAIGMLWSKVQNIEGSGSNNAGTTNTANTGAAPKTAKDPIAMAEALGIKKEDFQSCLDSDEPANNIKEDEASGQKAGVTGTPGNVIFNKKTGKSLQVPGAAPFSSFKTIIDEMLATGDAKNSATLGRAVPEVTPVGNGDYIRGNKDAEVFLIEYSDLECPFCIRFHPTAQQIVDEYDGKVAWVYRHFPLDQLHPNARAYARAAECAGKLKGNDGFWSMIDGFMK